MLARVRPVTVITMQAVAVGAVLVACSGRAKPVAPPSVATFNATTTSAFDPTARGLGPAVGGRTTIVVPLGPGAASMSGTVIGPDGPVAGAVVRVERIVEGSIGSMNVPTQADGTWTLPGILGGLYRVRGWREPDLADTNADVFYLNGTQTRQEVVRLDRFTGTQVTAALAPDPAIIGQPAQLVVQATRSVVDSGGVVRSTGQRGSQVQLFGQGQWVVSGSPSQTTDANGNATWTLTCEQLGPQPLSVVVDAADVVALNLAPCAPVPPTTVAPTSVPPSTTSTTGGSTTTTTKRHIP